MSWCSFYFDFCSIIFEPWFYNYCNSLKVGKHTSYVVFKYLSWEESNLLIRVWHFGTIGRLINVLSICAQWSHVWENWNWDFKLCCRFHMFDTIFTIWILRNRALLILQVNLFRFRFNHWEVLILNLRLLILARFMASWSIWILIYACESLNLLVQQASYLNWFILWLWCMFWYE